MDALKLNLLKTMNFRGMKVDEWITFYQCASWFYRFVRRNHRCNAL
jgi:hypothetical protein